MNESQKRRALTTAVAAAQAAGRLMARNFYSHKTIASQQQHDIKLELDVRCQKVIEARLRRDFPQFAVLGEEGITGDTEAEFRWVVDPIDGTVNFTYQIPHACVSIALQQRRARPGKTGEPYETIVGVVLDPFCKELWTAMRGGSARLNGKPIRASRRTRLAEAVVAIGFSKDKEMLDAMLPSFNQLVYRIRKIRIMGAAALAMVYVASGRFDAYVEAGVRLWDIAAGGLILECAEGEFWRRPIDGEHRYQINANNGRLRKKIEQVISGEK